MIEAQLLGRYPKRINVTGGLTKSEANGVTTLGFDYSTSEMGAQLGQAVSAASGYAAAAQAAQEAVSGYVSALNNRFPTRAAVEALEIPTSLTEIIIDHYAAGLPYAPAIYRQGDGTEVLTDAGGTKWHLVFPEGRFDPRWFGDPVDGTDASAAWAKLATALTENGGGTIIKPWGIIGLGSSITFKADGPINFIGNDKFTLAAPESSSYFRPLDDFEEPMFTFENDGVGAGSTVGGTIAGIAVADDLNLDDSDIEARRTYEVDAAFDLTTFALGKFTGNQVENIKGTAVRVGQGTMTSVNGNIIRYCGDTNKPSIHGHDPESGADPNSIQSFMVFDNRVEVSFGPYVQLDGYAPSGNAKVSGNGFEAATTEAPGSNQPYVRLIGIPVSSITANHFGRNLENAIECVSGGGGDTVDVVITGNNFQSIEGSCVVASANSRGVVFTGNSIFASPGGQPTSYSGASPAKTIDLAGRGHQVTNNTFRYSGLIYCDAPRSAVSGNIIFDPSAPTSSNIITLTENATGAVANNNNIEHTLDGVSGADDAAKIAALSLVAVSVEGPGQTAANNTVSNFSDGVVIKGDNARVFDNDLAACTNPIELVGPPSSPFIRDNGGFITEAHGVTTVASGDSSVTVSHGMSVTPDPADICVTYADVPRNTKACWASAADATTITLSVDTAASGGNIGLRWSAIKYAG